jgi:hypothetical protein
MGRGYRANRHVLRQQVAHDLRIMAAANDDSVPSYGGEPGQSSPSVDDRSDNPYGFR